MNRAERRRDRKIAEKAAKKAKLNPSAGPSPEKQTQTLQQALDLAVQHYTAGRLPQAESICQQILQADPSQPVPMHMLGVIAHQVGKNDISIDFITKALAIKPDYVEAQNSLGNVLKELGRLDEAVDCYHKALAILPDYAEAHYNLSISHKELGQLDEAVASYRKALAIKPDYVEAHFNLGAALFELGQLDEAVASYRKALAIKPDYAEAHSNLGNMLRDLGKLDEAVASYKKALAIKPDYVETHINLGAALQELGRMDEAISNYHKALAIKPDLAEAHYNLGISLNELGKLDEAVASYRKALAINPDYVEAHSNLGNVLRDLGKLDEAVACYHKALAIKPDYVEAHNNLGIAFNELGKLDEAKAAFYQGFRINHGGPWWNAATFADGDSAGTAPPVGAIFTSTFKLRDTIDQLEYLITKGRIDPSFQCMADRYRAVLAEIQQREEPEGVTKLTLSQQESLGSFYNRVIHYAEAPRIGTGAVNGSLDFKQIEDRYLSSPVSVTTLDDFLTPEALRGLRDFCLESTVFFDHTGNYLVGSRLQNGFNCDLLYQMAEEVKERFPRILGGHPLNNMWIYRYNNQSEGVAAHTDRGAVTFNFWITPDDANRIPDRGGLIVYTKEQPYDWDWRHFNREKYTPTVSREIADFLADADTVTIPYRENRALLFHSNLFHKSDQIHFRDGYENRRMNITLLFGNREG